LLTVKYFNMSIAALRGKRSPSFFSRFYAQCNLTPIAETVPLDEASSGQRPMPQDRITLYLSDVGFLKDSQMPEGVVVERLAPIARGGDRQKE
jgi:hypothetical protein